MKLYSVLSESKTPVAWQGDKVKCSITSFFHTLDQLFKSHYTSKKKMGGELTYYEQVSLPGA